MGPTSDVIGRRMVYVVSFGSFTAWSWGVAFAPNYAALVVFRFLGTYILLLRFCKPLTTDSLVR